MCLFFIWSQKYRFIQLKHQLQLNYFFLQKCIIEISGITTMETKKMQGTQVFLKNTFKVSI